MLGFYFMRSKSFKAQSLIREIIPGSGFNLRVNTIRKIKYDILQERSVKNFI